MSVLDLIIAFIVLIGLWRGYKAGFIYSSIGLVGWFIALVAATRLADDVAPQMASFVASPVLQSALGFLAVVLVIMVVMQIIGHLATKTVDMLKLGLLNKFAGGVLGAAKNVMIILIVFSISAPLLMRTPMWQASTIAPELLPYAPFAKAFASEVLDSAWDELNKS